MKHNAFRWIPAVLLAALLAGFTSLINLFEGKDRSLCPPGWQP